jgi:hypothetical protein
MKVRCINLIRGTGEDYTGKRFGLLVVQGIDENKSKSRRIYWLCECDCGKLVSIRQDGFKKQRSCGCIRAKSLIVGKTFGRLTVIKLNIDKKTHNCGANYKCVCSCGNTVDVFLMHLNVGATRSCGCLARETVIKQMTTHGKSNTRLFRIWTGVKGRCNNVLAPDYSIYGGRGISICDEWHDDFVSFYNWAINNGYSDNLSIDRIDNNGNYCPDNCKWSTPIEQQNNTRLNIRCIINNKLFTSIADVARFYKMTYKKTLHLYHLGRLEEFVNKK